MTSRLVWGMEGTNYLKEKRIMVEKEKDHSASSRLRVKSEKTHRTAVAPTAAPTAPQDAAAGC